MWLVIYMVLMIGTGEYEQFVIESDRCFIKHQPLATTQEKGASARVAQQVILNITGGACDPRLIVRTCAPLVSPSNWRNTIARSVIAAECPSIHIISRYNVTVPMWGMHSTATAITAVDEYGVEGRSFQTLVGGQDCTHYAYSPFLYEPFWDELVRVLRRGGPVDTATHRDTRTSKSAPRILSPFLPVAT
jgi:hypothetical protein